MKSRSAKNKGRRLQKWVAERLLEVYPRLGPDDVKSAIMGESGEDIKLSTLAKKLVPFSFECKNVEKINIWNAWEQAEYNAEDRQPAVVFKRNRTDAKVVIDFEVFLKLLGSYNELQNSRSDGSSSNSYRILDREPIQLPGSDQD